MENFGSRQACKVIVICFIWAANLPAMKILFSGITPVCASGLRFAIGAVVLILWAMASRMKIRVHRRHWFSLLIIGVTGAAIFIFVSNGLDRTTVQRGSILIYSHPIITALFAHFVFPDDRLTPRKAAGLLLSFCGVAIIFAHGIKVGETSYLLGDALVFAGAICWAFFTIYSKKVNQVVDPLLVIMYELIIAAPLLLLVSVIMKEEMIVAFTTPVAVALLYAGVVATLSYVVWNGMLKIYPATRLSSFVFLCPVFGVILGGLFLKEGFELKIIAALALVAAGIKIVNSSSIKR